MEEDRVTAENNDLLINDDQIMEMMEMLNDGDFDVFDNSDVAVLMDTLIVDEPGTKCKVSIVYSYVNCK